MGAVLLRNALTVYKGALASEPPPGSGSSEPEAEGMFGGSAGNMTFAAEQREISRLLLGRWLRGSAGAATRSCCTAPAEIQPGITQTPKKTKKQAKINIAKPKNTLVEYSEKSELFISSRDSCNHSFLMESN